MPRKCTNRNHPTSCFCTFCDRSSGTFACVLMMASLFGFIWVQVVYVPTVNPKYLSYLNGGGSCKVTLREQVSCFQFKCQPKKGIFAYRAIPLDIFDATEGADEILEQAADECELLGETTCSRYDISFHLKPSIQYAQRQREANILRSGQFDALYTHFPLKYPNPINEYQRQSSDSSFGNLIKLGSISIDNTTGEVKVPLGMYQTIRLDQPEFDFQKQKHPYNVGQSFLQTYQKKPYVDIQLNASYSNCKYVLIKPNTLYRTDGESFGTFLIDSTIFKVLLNPPTKVDSWEQASREMDTNSFVALNGLGIACFGGLLFMLLCMCLLGRHETNKMGQLLPCGICPQILCPCDNDNNEEFNNVNSDHGEEHGSSSSAVEMTVDKWRSKVEMRKPYTTDGEESEWDSDIDALD